LFALVLSVFEASTLIESGNAPDSLIGCFYLERHLRWRVGFLPNEGRLMTLPQTTPSKRRTQIFSNHEARMKAALEILEKENRSLKQRVVQLSALVIRKVTGKK
jgi:hypothetical protein